MSVEGAFTLLAEIYKLAIRDAQSGDRQAALWLDRSFPDWRKLAPPHRKTKRGRRPGLVKLSLLSENDSHLGLAKVSFDANVRNLNRKPHRRATAHDNTLEDRNVLCGLENAT